MPRGARNRKNPFTGSPELLQESARHFADHCASCHGNDGSGATEMGRNFFPRVPDMRSDATQRLSDGELYYIIHNGVRWTGMPAWGDPDNDSDSWKLVLFIRHLPQLAPAELTTWSVTTPGASSTSKKKKKKRTSSTEAQPHRARPSRISSGENKMKKSAVILLATLLLSALAFAHGNLAHVIGTVVAITDHSVSVKTGDGSIKVVAFDGETHFMKGDLTATAKDVAVGSRVVIHAHQNGDKLHAAEIKIGSASANDSNPTPKETR